MSDKYPMPPDHVYASIFGPPEELVFRVSTPGPNLILEALQTAAANDKADDLLQRHTWLHNDMLKSNMFTQWKLMSIMLHTVDESLE
jgi:hypothetical protein